MQTPFHRNFLRIILFSCFLQYSDSTHFPLTMFNDFLLCFFFLFFSFRYFIFNISVACDFIFLHDIPDDDGKCDENDKQQQHRNGILQSVCANNFAMMNHIGWLDDGLFIQRDADKRGGSSSGIGGGECDNRRNIIWNNFSSHHAFTTGRQPRPTDPNFGGKVRPKGPSQTLKVSIHMCEHR